MENRRPLLAILVTLAVGALLFEWGVRCCNVTPMPAIVHYPEPPELKLTFGGDIMAHKSITSMKDFSRIYRDIAFILKADDLTFANLETPIVNSKNYTAYPRFSVKEEFVQAAIDGGVDVFSLANNHTNDHGLEGLKDTLAFFAKQPSDKTYYAGIRKSLLKSMSFSFIEVRNWKILFVSVSDFSNKSDYEGPIDLIQRSDQARTIFRKQLKELREKYPCDLLVVSFHANVPEYARTPANTIKDFYHALSSDGVDIVWGAHPHLVQGWEIIKGKTKEEKDKVIIYSLGSLISSQRGKPNYKDPEDIKEYTGDGALLQLWYVKKGGLPFVTTVNPVITTIHRDKDAGRAVKPLVRDFTGGADEKLDAYYNKRLELMQQITGETVKY